MTYKQPDGLDPRRYKNRTSASVSRSFVRRNGTSQVVLRERRSALAQVRTARRTPAGRAASIERRVVTMPHEAVQPLTWAERHARYRAHSGEHAAEERLVPRTLAQTGRPALGGQMRVRKPLPRSRSTSRIPSRSGKLRNRRSIWRRLWAFLFVLAVVVGGLSFALFGPTFRVQQVDISGTQNQKLIASIKGIGMEGQDIFLLNQAALVTRLEALAPIASASLGVQLPGTVLVDVQERTPVLLWQAGKTTFALGQDGVVIAPQSELDGTDHLALVVDTRRSAGQIHPGTRFNTADMVFIEQVFEQVPGIEGVAPFSLHYVDRINEDGRQVPANIAGSGSYVIVSVNGWQAYLGDSQNSTTLATRLLELQQILKLARQQNVRIATIDLRFGLRPTYTLKS